MIKNKVTRRSIIFLLQNDRMNGTIYCIPLWYEYPLQVQKTFLMLLQLSSIQTKQAELWVGPFAPLNVETGIKVRKAKEEIVLVDFNSIGFILDDKKYIFVLLHGHE